MGSSEAKGVNYVKWSWQGERIASLHVLTRGWAVPPTPRTGTRGRRYKTKRSLLDLDRAVLLFE